MGKYQVYKKRTFEIIEKAQGEDKVSRCFDMMILCLIVLNTVAIVLESFNPLYEAYGYYFKVFEVLSVIVFTLEYLLRIWTADLAYSTYHKKRHAIRRYVLSPMALIDLFAILPFYLPMVIPVDLRFLRLFRFSRLMRLLKINRYTKALIQIGEVITAKKDELVATVFLMCFMIMMSSTMMYFFESEVQPEAFPNIVASFWWAIATLTTVGYGDVYPITIMGKFFASITALLGIGLVALPTGIISSGFVELISKKKVKKEDTLERRCPHCGQKMDQ